ncbi:HAD family phosphatase [Kribbella sp. NBC_01484]|uniref:HAD family hydrolase n=1 Tax=Kribbella sp. NBC_01484 TaxID=2903579 RepID=UPI002E321930|nr:HAD family phosphatase [Kribbella sp. NBC_01484]
MTTESPASALRSTQAVLLDFDGPVCSVFAGYPAPQIAEELRALIRDAIGDVPAAIADANGPHEVLAASASLGNEIWRRVEEALQAAEIKAAESATPTPGVEPFLDACKAADRPVAIVSNNCEASVRTYLEHAALADYVRHIEARDPIHVDRMKPSPYLVRRAADALTVAPGRCVLIGDQVSDVTAAIAAGARSIGYANKPGKAVDLAAAGADAVTDDLRSAAALVGLPS